MVLQIASEETLFDVPLLRQELTDFADHYGKNKTKLRSKVLEQLKELTSKAHESAVATLKEDGNGRACASSLSNFQDELIRALYDFTIHHIYRSENPTSSERMSVIATGGYGRRLLAPGSDVDLLFLLPYKQTAWGESVIEYLLYLLWDLGLKVGHATRTIEQSVRLSLSDMTIRTSILDARLIWGDEDLFNELVKAFQRRVVSGSGREFIEAKLAEQDSRHEKSGSRYLVEPNIKDGKGSLRDIHMIGWLVKYLSDHDALKDPVAAGIFTPEEYHSLLKCEDFLWTIRCHLHFLTGRPEERLSFDLQPVMAEKLGYTSRGGLQAVERFMKHYFLVAKDIGDLTRIVCSDLEMKELKQAPRLNRLLDAFTWLKPKQQISESNDFHIDHGRINVVDENVFTKDPVNLIRMFFLAEQYNVTFHPEAFRLVRGSLRLINDDLRNDPEANQIFLTLLTSKTSSENALRKMNESGVLGRFIPDFGRISSMMQFNMYHHYTVDEHLIRSVGILNEIENGDRSESNPLATKIFPTIQKRRALYVTMFLHDIAKGREEDHSIVGAEVARELCPRFGLGKTETESVAWLIENHLVMSHFAQSRDLNDTKTIRDFSEIIQSPERLKLLLILTVADIRAVGPGVWNGWKGQLLRQLYFETEAIVSGGYAETANPKRVELAQNKLREALADWPAEKVERMLSSHYSSYWLRTDLKRQIEHAHLMSRLGSEGKTVVADVQIDAFTAVTSLTIFAPRHPSLLPIITGVCASISTNIVDAQISTTRDGMALDTIFLQREFEREEDERRRADRILLAIYKLIDGEMHFKTLHDQMVELKGRISAFTVEPEVLIDNSLSNELTVIEVNGLDRPGLLFQLTTSIAKLSLDIASAHIATFGEKVIDVFYVTDLLGKKITDEKRKDSICKTLVSVLGQGRGQDRKKRRSIKKAKR